MNQPDHCDLYGLRASSPGTDEPQNELTKMQRTLLCIFVLFPLFVVIYFIAFLLRFEGNLIRDNRWTIFALTFSGVVLLKMMVFLWFRVHHILGRFVTFQDLITLIKAASTSLAALVVIIYIASIVSIPRSVLLIDWGLTIMSVGGLLQFFAYCTKTIGRRSLFSPKKCPR